MNQDGVALIRIRKELELEVAAVQRVADDYGRIPQDIPDWIRVRAQASLLHDFYTGLERAFCRIVQELNGGLPRSEQWHRDLLQDMALNLEGVRPAVITEGLRRDLIPYLRFRHLFRNVYGFELEAERMAFLDQAFVSVCSRALTELRDEKGQKMGTDLFSHRWGSWVEPEKINLSPFSQ